MKPNLHISSLVALLTIFLFEEVGSAVEVAPFVAEGTVVSKIFRAGKEDPAITKDGKFVMWNSNDVW